MLAMSEELKKIISAEKSILSNIESSEAIRDLMVGFPLTLSGEVFKEIFSYTLGFRLLLTLTDVLLHKFPSIWRKKISLPTLLYIAAPEDSTYPGFTRGVTVYTISWGNFPFVILNYLACNLGKIAGWVLVSPWTIPVHIIIKIVVNIVNSYHENKSWWNLRKVDKAQLALVVFDRKIPYPHGEKLISYLSEKDILEAAELCFLRSTYAKKEHAEKLIRFYYNAIDKRQLRQKRNLQIFIAISAVIFTPLSLFVLVPIYKRIVKNHTIVHMRLTPDEFNKKSLEKSSKIEKNIQKLGDAPSESSTAKTILLNRKNSARKIYCSSHHKENGRTIELYYQYSTQEQFLKQSMKNEIGALLIKAQSLNATKSSRTYQTYSLDMLVALEKAYDKFSSASYWDTKKPLLKSFLIVLSEYAYKCEDVRKAIFYIGKVDFSELDLLTKEKCYNLIIDLAMRISNDIPLGETVRQKNARLIKLLAVLSVIPESDSTQDIKTLKTNYYVEILKGRISPDLALEDVETMSGYDQLQIEVDKYKKLYLSSPVNKQNKLGALMSLVKPQRRVSPK